MPELPEVETVRRGLQPYMEGASFRSLELRRADLRFPFPDNFGERLMRRTVRSLNRRAKYLLLHLDNDDVLVCHLGMSGSFRIEADGTEDMPGAFALPRNKSDLHDHVVFHMSGTGGAKSRIIYNDPRRFGFMLLMSADELRVHRFFEGLGIEPTGNTLDGTTLSAALTGKKTPLKAALLDQRLVAGLGNIYVCEALWRAGLDPRRVASSITARSRLSRERCDRLATAIREVIADAIKAGGSSLRDYVHTDGSLGYFQHSFSVYGREGENCPRPGCKGSIKRVVQSGRSTFFCPACQR